jgi:hypothetical protein
LTRVADPRQDGPARALQRGLGESIPTAVYCSLGARAPSEAGCGREAARVRWFASPGILRLGGRRSPSGRAGLASRPPIGSRRICPPTCGLFRRSDGVAPTLSALKSFGARVDLLIGVRAARGQRGLETAPGRSWALGPPCARSRKERRFLARRVGGQATLASASPPDATRPGRRGSPATSSAQPAAPPDPTAVHRCGPASEAARSSRRSVQPLAGSSRPAKLITGPKTIGGAIGACVRRYTWFLACSRLRGRCRAFS